MIRSVLHMASIAALALTALPAQATSFIFSYVTAPGETITGVFNGTLQSDNDTVVISTLVSIALNGTQITTPLSVASTDAAYGLRLGASPSVKLDKSLVDFYISNGNALNNQYLGFAVGDSASAYQGNLAGATGLFGGNGSYQSFSPSSFTIAAAMGAVPEPGTWAMMLTGFGLVGVLLRRRRSRVALAA